MRDMPNFFHAQHGFYTYISCPKRDQVHKGDFFFFIEREQVPRGDFFFNIENA